MELRGRLVTGLTSLALLLPLGLVGLPAAQARTARPAVGDTKTPCAYTADSIADLHTLAKKIGSPMDCALLFNDTAADWDTFEQPWLTKTTVPDYQWPAWSQAKPGRRLIVTQAMVPIGLPADWRARGASGEYDNHIKAWAANMIATGYGSATIRLGHEANGDWYFDSIGNTVAEQADWAAFWARFTRVAKSVPGAHFLFDWTVNAGYLRIPFAQYYPGNAAVDIIGIDQYDGMAIAPQPMPTTPQEHWAALATQQWGLNDLIAFAASHHKPMSIPEWGVMTAGSANGTGAGDDPRFVDGIAAVVRTHDVSYEDVWDTRSPTSPMAVAIEDSPAAMAAYKKHFGRHGDALPGPAARYISPPMMGPPVGTASGGGATHALVRTRVFLSVSGRKVKPGGLVRMTALLVGNGQIQPGRRLLLEQLVGKRWSVIAKVTTGAKGRAVLTHRPGKTGLYRVAFSAAGGRAASASPVLTVHVSQH
jgi:Glycosyl hydrolase family 26